MRFWPPNLEFLLGFPLIGVFMLAYALRKGEFPFGHVPRAATPIRFWIHIAFFVVTSIGCLIWAAIRIVHDMSN